MLLLLLMYIYRCSVKKCHKDVPWRQRDVDSSRVVGTEYISSEQRSHGVHSTTIRSARTRERDRLYGSQVRGRPSAVRSQTRARLVHRLGPSSTRRPRPSAHDSRLTADGSVFVDNRSRVDVLRLAPDVLVYVCVSCHRRDPALCLITRYDDNVFFFF